MDRLYIQSHQHGSLTSSTSLFHSPTLGSVAPYSHFQCPSFPYLLSPALATYTLPSRYTTTSAQQPPSTWWPRRSRAICSSCQVRKSQGEWKKSFRAWSHSPTASCRNYLAQPDHNPNCPFSPLSKPRSEVLEVLRVTTSGHLTPGLTRIVCLAGPWPRLPTHHELEGILNGPYDQALMGYFLL